jgi:hypothetical protein
MTLRRTGLARHKGLERGGPLRPVSDRKLKAAGGWLASTLPPKRPTPAVPPARRKTLADRSDGWCEIQLAGCQGRAVHPHHRITTKSGGRHGAAKVEHDQLSDLLHVCWYCHDVVTREPKWAKRWVNGWSLDESDIPAQHPVLYRGELSYLDDAGSVHSLDKAGA